MHANAANDSNSFNSLDPSHRERQRLVGHKSRQAWEWNIPLLVGSVIVGGVLCGLLAGVYVWQSKRLCGELLSRAEISESAQDYKNQVVWLNRYIRMVPNDVGAFIKIGIATDNALDSTDDPNRARTSLSRAIAVTGNSPAYAVERDELRRRLIKRLLQLGVEWATEAEKQVILLNAAPGNPESLGWIVRAMFSQRLAGQRRSPSEGKADQATEYWKWISSQPVGSVLRTAIRANPNDIELQSYFLSAVQGNPDWFEGGEETLSRDTLQQDLNEIIVKLAAQQDDGRAQLAAYSAKLERDPDGAASLLDIALPKALVRLEDHFRRSQSESMNKPSASSAPSKVESGTSLDSSEYQPIWDWQLALQSAAKALTQKRVGDAQEIYQKLIGLNELDISPEQKEVAYRSAGQTYWLEDKTDQAISIWEAGIESIGNSVELMWIIAGARTSLGQTVEAEKALERLDKMISRELLRLDGPDGALINKVRKIEMRNRLDIASWEADSIRGKLLFQREDYRGASERLLRTFNSPLSVSDESRIGCGRALAACYLQLQLWDLSGQVLDRCVALRPDDVSLRRLASEAWRRSGANERVTLQLDSLDDGSYSAALEIARLTGITESRKPAAQRNPDLVRRAISDARKKWEFLSDKDRVAQPIWPLEMLELDFPEKPVSNRQDLAARLAAIAAANPMVSEVQMIAATSLARQGSIDEAKAAVDRLRKIAAQTGVAVDSANVIISDAYIAEATGDVSGATGKIRDGMNSVPSEALRLAKTGVDMALRQEQPQYSIAYELLQLVPQEMLDVGALLALGRLGTLSFAIPTGLNISEKDVEKWIESLKNLEGDEGCHWRYLSAQHLIAKARLIDKSRFGAKHADLLSQAEKHFVEIERRRPRWGVGLAVGGHIAVMKGAFNEAVPLLRRAIREGDSQLSTSTTLVELLRRTAQYDQAEQELERLKANTDSQQSLSLLEVSIAQSKGDQRRALELARALTAQNPGDLNSWLAFFQTAVTVSALPNITDEEKARLRAEALQAIDQAAKITGGKNIAVWNAKFRYHLDAKELDQARQVLADLQSSPLLPNISLIACANGFLQLNDLKAAQECADKAMLADPKSAQPHVTKAQILERVGDRQGLLRELKTAHGIDSQNAEIRERLAMAYVLISDEIPWNEVDDLLKDSGEAATTKSRLQKALLSLQRGNDERIKNAVATLREIASSNEPEATVAKRIIARYFGSRWLKYNPEGRESENGMTEFLEARKQYEELASASPPDPGDLFFLAIMLMEAKHIEASERVVQKLSTIAGTSILALQLQLTLAKAKNEDVSKAASAWVDSAQGLEADQLWELVGRTMLEMNFKDESLIWLEKAYQKNTSRFPAYAVGLAKAGQIGKAVELCLDQLQQDGKVDAATLLAEISLVDTAQQASEKVEKALAEAFKKYPNSVPMLEAIATLRLMQERFPDSAALYEQVEKLSPNRPRTLNNMAIALAELPMRGNLALEKIEKAIQLYGRLPELLDTLAIVQSKLGHHKNAKVTLEEVISRSKDPRFQMRLVEELIALNDMDQAKKVWEKLDLKRLETLTMMKAEQRSYKTLVETFGKN